MTITYGLTIDNQNLINDKAKTKNNGVFSFRGVTYKVANNKVVAFACDGEVKAQFGAFNVIIGTYEIGTETAKSALSRVSGNE